MKTPSPSDIVQGLAEIGQFAAPDEAKRLASEIARHASLDHLASALANDEASRMLALLLAWRAFMREEADPGRRIARLLQQAADLDFRAEPSWIEAAELHGKAAARRLRGEPDLADAFQRRAEAAEHFAIALEDEALCKRLKAARLRASGFLQAIAA